MRRSERGVVDLSRVPLSELRRRFNRPDCPPSTSVIDALVSDTRAGARLLGARLQRVRAALRAEEQRLRGIAALEARLRRQGMDRVAGVDEVGVGPLAGPVVAAAVILPPGLPPHGVDDSKRLTRPARERLDAEIRRVAREIGVGWASPEEIDRLNVYQAGLLAMRRAVEALPEPPDCLVVDARTIPDLEIPQEPVTGGDRRVAAIAAASVVAKVYRDAWMRDLGRRYPGYGLARNMGYGTREHLRCLAAHGPSPAHRVSYAPVRAAGAMRREF
jgi:ribonuclease HII